MRTSERDSRHEEIYTGNGAPKVYEVWEHFSEALVPHVTVIEWWNLSHNTSRQAVLDPTGYLCPSRSMSTNRISH